jgi:hypothetical protein
MHEYCSFKWIDLVITTLLVSFPSVRRNYLFFYSTKIRKSIFLSGSLSAGMFSNTGMFYIAPYVHSRFHCQAFGVSSNEKYVDVTLYVPVLVHVEVQAINCMSLKTINWRNVTDTQQETLFILPK